MTTIIYPGGEHARATSCGDWFSCVGAEGPSARRLQHGRRVRPGRRRPDRAHRRRDRPRNHGNIAGRALDRVLLRGWYVIVPQFYGSVVPGGDVGQVRPPGGRQYAAASCWTVGGWTRPRPPGWTRHAGAGARSSWAHTCCAGCCCWRPRFWASSPSTSPWCSSRRAARWNRPWRRRAAQPVSATERISGGTSDTGGYRGGRGLDPRHGRGAEEAVRLRQAGLASASCIDAARLPDGSTLAARSSATRRVLALIGAEAAGQHLAWACGPRCWCTWSASRLASRRPCGTGRGSTWPPAPPCWWAMPSRRFLFAIMLVVVFAGGSFVQWFPLARLVVQQRCWQPGPGTSARWRTTPGTWCCRRWRWWRAASQASRS